MGFKFVFSKVLLVGDSDVGKQEIITGMEDGSLDSPYCSSTGAGTSVKLCMPPAIYLIYL